MDSWIWRPWWLNSLDAGMFESLDVVVVGAGQAGLALSHALSRRAIDHVIVERGRVGETWRTQRWRSFRLNGPAARSALPGLALPGDPGAFVTAQELVDYFEAYRTAFSLPVREHTTITGCNQQQDGGFILRMNEGQTLGARHVVAAAGELNVPSVPECASAVPTRVTQLHSAEYVDAEALPPGGVLLVGGAQTGCQIAEDLIDAGRPVWIATSRVPRVPRRYRGRDIFDWLTLAGYYDERTDSVPNDQRRVPNPQITGVAGGHSVSYHQLARKGVRLLGRLEGFSGAIAHFAADRQDHVRFADEMSRRIKAQIDAYIERSGLAAPDATPDHADDTDPSTLVSFPATAIDVEANGIACVIWCTGLHGDLSWLPPAALDARGQPRHRDGIGALRGTYFVGFPWLSCRGSGILLGVGADAEHVAATITQRLRT